MTLLLAGHETTATALAWAVYELSRAPELARRAARAVEEDDDRYLEAVFSESLRRHPVISMVGRQLSAPTRVGGFDLPRGATVAVSILLGHADGAAHTDPDRFDPQRFLDGEVATNTWLPFGGGVRRCLGAGFSLLEGVSVLRAVLAGYDLSPGDTRPDEPSVRNITSVPRRGALVVAVPR